MLSLDETQSRFRRVVAGHAAESLLPHLKSAGDPRERLEIYRRHYRESFRRHLRGRYPTLEWLVGTDAMITFADTLLATAPPRAPSLAEYGAEMPDVVVAARPETPWLALVAQLDWRLGCLSVAVADEPAGIAALASVPAAALLEVTLRLQPGLVFLQADWPVDTLVHLRLSGAAPDQLQFEPEHVHLELRGGRGRFQLQRLTPAAYVFRRALAEGRRLGIAADRALSADQNFDITQALAQLFGEGLVTAINPEETTR